MVIFVQVIWGGAPQGKPVREWGKQDRADEGAGQMGLQRDSRLSQIPRGILLCKWAPWFAHPVDRGWASVLLHQLLTGWGPPGRWGEVSLLRPIWAVAPINRGRFSEGRAQQQVEACPRLLEASGGSSSNVPHSHKVSSEIILGNQRLRTIPFSAMEFKLYFHNGYSREERAQCWESSDPHFLVWFSSLWGLSS